MIPTFIGGAVALAGVLLLARGGVPAMMAMLMVCVLMPGSAALALPALGGSTVPPVQFALVFLALRLVVGDPRFDLVARSMRLNAWLGVYVLYGAVMAMLGPRMFGGLIHVVPMHLDFSGMGIITSPLAPTPQNVTAAVYLIGTLAISVCVGAAVLHEGGLRRFVATAVVVVWIMAFLGVSGALLAGTAWSDVLDLMRNGNYAQTEQNFGSLSRIKGIAPEPSTYATSAFLWFVFMAECWSRDVMPRRTGPAAAAMGLVLLFSTSSTAYVGLAAYALAYVARTAFVPGSISFAKMLTLAACGFVAALAVAAVAMLVPAFAAMFVDMINAMTVGKSSSMSAMERAAWAAQGLDAFAASHGLGIGPGSFRSSSLATAVLGSTGIVGSAALLAHLAKVFRPLRPSTYQRTDDGAAAVGISASWAAVLALAPALLSATSGDPGPDFAIMSGAALVLRRRARATETPPATGRAVPDGGVRAPARRAMGRA